MPTAPTGIYWDFCGNVCSGRENSVAMETECLLCQAESLGGRTISGMPGMANLGVFPGPGRKATRNPPPRARESHPFKHSLAHSFNKHQLVYIRHCAGVVEINPTRSRNSRRPQSGGETGV